MMVMINYEIVIKMYSILLVMQNCNKWYKKPKIFIFVSFDSNTQDESQKEQENESKENANDYLISMVDNNKIEFQHQYKRILY